MKKLSYYLLAIGICLTLVVTPTYAAYDTVTVTTDTDLFLTDSGLTTVLTTNSSVESYTVNSGSIEFVMSSGSVVELLSHDRRPFTVTGAGSCSQTTSCEQNRSRLYISCTSGQTITVTLGDPVAACTGSNSSGGGGGGGGSAAPASPVAPVVPPTAPATPAPTQTPVPTSVEPENTTIVTTPVFTFTKLLRRGSSGAEVVELQKKLQALGFFPADTVANGVFGPQTEKSVKDFQKANGLSQVGFTGPGTRGALNGSTVSQSPAPVIKEIQATTKNFTFTKLLRRGSSGAEVVELQKKLQALGFFPADTVANGVFGPQTEKSVKDFQKANGIAQVGYTGPGTRGALNQ